METRVLKELRAKLENEAFLGQQDPLDQLGNQVKLEEMGLLDQEEKVGPVV